MHGDTHRRCGVIQGGHSLLDADRVELESLPGLCTVTSGAGPGVACGSPGMAAAVRCAPETGGGGSVGEASPGLSPPYRCPGGSRASAASPGSSGEAGRVSVATGDAAAARTRALVDGSSSLSRAAAARSMCSTPADVTVPLSRAGARAGECAGVWLPAAGTSCMTPAHQPRSSICILSTGVSHSSKVRCAGAQRSQTPTTAQQLKPH